MISWVNSAKHLKKSILCFLESENYEDAIRNCVWLGGDCDTTGAICGGIAEAFYGSLDDELSKKVMNKLDDLLKEIVIEFSDKISEKYGNQNVE